MKQIRCAVRQVLVAATPEELVRQKVLAWLNQDRKIPLAQIDVEANLNHKGNVQRADLLVWRKVNGALIPWILVECKAPGKMEFSAWRSQIQRYLDSIQVRFIIGSDGNELWIFEKDKEWLQRSELPLWQIQKEPS